MFGIALSLLISILTGKTSEVIIIILSFALLRQLSGGYHIKSSDGCVIFTVFLFTLISLISLNSITVLILNCS
ncbi:accessory gene regulator B family protein, partial [Paenibacillus odorifer]|uniref:accessory gene regulator B family protein n=1 Tax=Paenibacillus odorifer TaxID=189426 RepID=UPI00351BE5B6